MGDCIALPTDIAELTPDYLTEALRYGGHLTNGSVATVEASPLGAGIGFVGQLARLTLTYDGDNGGLPIAMVAKFPIVDPVAQYLARMFGFYRTEAGGFQPGPPNGLRVPPPPT